MVMVGSKRGGRVASQQCWFVGALVCRKKDDEVMIIRCT